LLPSLGIDLRGWEPDWKSWWAGVGKQCGGYAGSHPTGAATGAVSSATLNGSATATALHVSIGAVVSSVENWPSDNTESMVVLFLYQFSKSFQSVLKNSQRVYLRYVSFAPWSVACHGLCVFGLIV
jgi:hypothetical protein